MKTVLAFFAAICLLPPSLIAASTVTMPLQELLTMQEQLHKKEQKVSTRTGFAIEKVMYKGRLLDKGIGMKAVFDVYVFTETGSRITAKNSQLPSKPAENPGETPMPAPKTWTRIPILTVDGFTQLTRLPKIKDASFHLRNNRLYLITRRTGRHHFSLELIKLASRKGAVRSATLASAAALSTLELSVDGEHFTLLNPNLHFSGDRVTLLPRNNQYVVRWKTSAPLSSPKIEHIERQHREPVVEHAWSSVVAPLSGHRIIRVHYRLRLFGNKTIEVDVPESLVIKHVYINGAAITPRRHGNRLHITVRPAQTGEDHAALEMALEQDNKSYLLSGLLNYRLPSVSWTVNRYQLALYLPEVFNYRWKGGSLAATTEAFTPPPYRYQIPTPGKQIVLQQQLVQGHPDARIHYTVDLRGRYFQVGDFEPQRLPAAEHLSNRRQWVHD